MKKERSERMKRRIVTIKDIVNSVLKHFCTFEGMHLTFLLLYKIMLEL